MLRLSMTKYPVVTGLQGMFGKDYSKVEDYFWLNLGDVLLLLSICESAFMMYTVQGLFEEPTGFRKRIIT